MVRLKGMFDKNGERQKESKSYIAYGNKEEERVARCVISDK